ncbi:hypothetical protein HANVADRAFT_53197 [Hanseniaspora valbyensis NRRL Y-1626]|uniref:Membrane anchor Opy2 N-terminal domain-containing protein n=1 Tax=Hanseniaspora valbyensis NRRL Y-1626 TaxID=766949 RepID=A0A1B7TC86_9ASCO|nr:hypothetical protein HANVADRAFT_53197 [Hanseniaspora valbyensis NRRL Y-1626]
MVNLGITRALYTSFFEEKSSYLLALNKRDDTTTSFSSSSSSSSNGGSSITSSASATSTMSDGCVSCPTVSCPDCGDNYYCVMTSLTCTSCPITYCVKKSTTTTTTSTSSHKTNVGAIAGGVVGGVVGGLLVIAAIVYFFRRNKKKADLERRLHGKEKNGNIFNDDDLDDEDPFDIDEEYTKTGSNIYNNSANTLRSSTLDNDDALGLLPLSQNLLGNKRKKNDETSSVSTGNASNVIPVGYIPGIKTSGLKGFRPGQKKTIPDELKSHYTLGSSILGDLRDDDEEEEEGGVQNNNNKGSSLNALAEEDETESDFAVLVTPAKESHQTALRGKVSLVHINEGKNEEENSNNNNIPEEAEEDENSDDDDDSIVLDIDIDHNK